MEEIEFQEYLVGLFQDIKTIEESYVVQKPYDNLSGNDFKIIEAIGKTHPKNMSSVAKRLSVTVGTLTIAMNSLVKKGYVNRVRSEEDRRVVLISLSDQGKAAYEYLKAFQKEMIEALTMGLEETEVALIVKSLENLRNHFKK